jgi:hypothetical protein
LNSREDFEWILGQILNGLGLIGQGIIFQKWKAMILERLRWRFGFQLESNLDSNESGCFLLALLNLKQYSNTKLNAWRHECNNHLYRA